MRGFFKELQRRKVYTVGVAYAIVGWLLLQVADTVLPIYEAPDWVLQAFATVLFLGFPLALVLAWVFDLTRGGIVKTGKLQDDIITGEIELPTGPSIAVLPFANLSGNPEQDLFAEALSGDITTGLTRSSHLFVLSPGATAGLSAGSDDLIKYGKQLGVRYILQGSVQKSGEALRVAARLIEAETGIQAWSQNYDKQLTAENMFAVQDDIREQIVATLSDLHGVIYSVQTEKNIHRPTDNLDAYECLAVALAYDKYISPDYHLRGRDSLERAVQLDPGFDEAWAHLSWLYTDEFVWGFNPQPNSMKRALEAAMTAVKLAPQNYHNHWLLSRVYYFMGDKEQFLSETQRALELNSSDGTTLGLIGLYTAWSGDWKNGMRMMTKAKQLNPNYPDYYHVAFGTAAYNAEDYEQALTELLKANIPEFPMQPVFLAATYAMLNRQQEAETQAQQVNQVFGNATIESLEPTFNTWLPFQPKLVERMCAGLEKAGIPRSLQS